MKNSSPLFHINKGAVAVGLAASMPLIDSVSTTTTPRQSISLNATASQTITFTITPDSHNQQIPATSTNLALLNVRHEWDSKIQKRLDVLIGKHASECITDAEYAEMEKLRASRRQKQPTLTTAQTIRAAQKEEVLDTLLHAVNKYVQLSTNYERY